MKIIKIKDYDNEGGMTPDEADKELKKRGLRPLTLQEWIGLPEKEIEQYRKYTPIYLQSKKNGPAIPGFYDVIGNDYRGYVGFGYVGGDGRFGVFGVEDTPHKHKWKTKRICECGVEG